MPTAQPLLQPVDHAQQHVRELRLDDVGPDVAHVEPTTQPSAYLPTGLELWPTYRTVELREAPDAVPDGGSSKP